MFCTKCGASVTGKFCGVCGTPISQAAPPPPPVPPAQPTPPPQPPPLQYPLPQQQHPQPQPQFPQAQQPFPPQPPQYGGYQPPAAPVAAPVWEYASWGTRVLGYLIDSLLVAVVVGVLGILAFTVFGGLVGLGGGIGSEGLQGIGATGCCCLFSLFPIAILLIGLWNKVYLVAQRGYSIGQGVVKIKVVDAQGNLLTQGTALIRLLAQVGLSFIPIVGGFLDLLWPLWDDRRQTLHDKAVGCYVINNPAGR
jgi:uncharacterized RDD family membrane protein YckC